MKIGEGSTTHSPIQEKARRSGRGLWSLLASVAVMAAMIVPLTLLGPSSIAGAQPPSTSCGTDIPEPATLPAGTYSSVDVIGFCFVDGGNVTVTGNVTVEPGSALVAAFGLDDSNSPASGTSILTVQGNVIVGSGASLLLGCEASEFACVDDEGSPPTLNGSETVDGSIEATNALGVVVHNSTIGADAVETGGGGGQSCTPSGIFEEFGSPVYSDYEDNTIGGNLRVTGVGSCYFGALRDTIGGSFTYSDNTFFDPDASENLTNTVGGNLLCTNNSPAVQYGDSSEGGFTPAPNTVSGFATGECAFGVQQPSPAPTPSNSAGPLMLISQPGPTQGYWISASDGGVFTYNTPFLGSGVGHGTAPFVGIAATPGGQHYSLAQNTGAAVTTGSSYSDCAGLSGATLNQPVVGIAAAPGGNGCWMAASDGGVFSFGQNAPFFGSAGSLHLVKPVVGIGATPNNDGYDLVASDGGIFTYGPGAQFYGSMGGKPLNQPIVGIAVDPTTGGYWEVAKDGGIFAFNAPYFGSMGGKPLNAPIVGMAAAPGGNGYYLVASDGGIFTFGPGAVFQGSAGSIHLAKPIVGMALG
jgi:hypothetical protein